MVHKGCKAAALEVSSHGLDQGRVDEIDFQMALFTNLYPDHLDYHRTIEAYAFAKRKLFERAKRLILNADTPWSQFMAPKGLTYGIDTKADVKAEEVRFTSSGATFKVQQVPFSIPLMGRFNVSNALGAIAVGLEFGASLSQIAAILSTFGSVPGRLEPVSNERGLQIFVDFAHTGDALDNVLKSLRECVKGRLIVVFGCGGDRDPGRRIGMAEAAQKWADLSIVTSDNPRTESPEAIIRQILSGFKSLERVLVESDRREAIHRAIEKAREGDAVLIAGKGHEKVQIIGLERHSFDDRLVAKEALAKLIQL